MRRWTYCFVIVLVANSIPVAHSQEAAATDSEAVKRLQSYQITAGDGDKDDALELREQSALNWSNPVFGTTMGGVFLWTNDHRVAVVMKTYRTKNGRWFEQMRSFSDRPVVAKESDTAASFWSPPAAPEMQPLEDSPPPAPTGAARLVQMKALHRSFSVTGALASGEQELRPLPRPLYRYNSDGAIDGALLAYVQGTGPDLLLILEARMVDGKMQWYYTLGSVGIFAVEVERAGKVVWEEPRRTAQSTKPTDIYDGRRLERQ